MLSDSFLLLGLDEHALVQDVKDAYRRLARAAHPDAPGGDQRVFDSLNRAYQEVLDYAQHAPCAYCVNGSAGTVTAGFQVVRSTCTHCHGTGRRG